MRPVGALVPYASNSRTHTPEQIAKIAKSIESFGWTNPILVDGENGILAGHARLQAAQQLGLAQVPTIELAYPGRSLRCEGLAELRASMKSDVFTAPPESGGTGFDQ